LSSKEQPNVALVFQLKGVGKFEYLNHFSVVKYHKVRVLRPIRHRTRRLMMILLLPPPPPLLPPPPPPPLLMMMMMPLLMMMMMPLLMTAMLT
jgi:hypothetical protein